MTEHADDLIPEAGASHSQHGVSAAAAALGPAFLDALLADFATHGAAAIRRCREDNPATYLRICAGLMPKQLTIESAHELEEAELDKRIRQLAARLAIEIGAGGAVDGEGEAAEPEPSVGLPAIR